MEENNKYNEEEFESNHGCVILAVGLVISMMLMGGIAFATWLVKLAVQ